MCGEDEIRHPLHVPGVLHAMRHKDIDDNGLYEVKISGRRFVVRVERVRVVRRYHFGRDYGLAPVYDVYDVVTGACLTIMSSGKFLNRV